MTCQHGQRTMTSSSDISDYRIECGSQSALTCAPDRTKLKCTQPRTSPKLSSGEEYGWWFLVPKVIKLYNIPTHYQNPFWWVFPSTLVFNKKGWQYILLLLLLLLLLSQEVMSDSATPRNMPGFSVHHQFSELVQTHVHWVDDAIQSSHPLLSPSPLAFNCAKYQGK